MATNAVRTIQHQVYEIIKANISAGIYKPNQRLQEIDIATELNVSRSPVREAFRELTAEGLLEAFPNKGVYVKEFSEQDFREIFELRLVFETHAIRKLNESAMEALEPALDEAERRLRNAYKNRDTEAYAKADGDFHKLLVEGCGNNLLIANYRRTITMVRHSIHYALRAPDRFGGSEREHGEIFELLRQRRYKEAAQANGAHLINTCDALIEQAFGKKSNLFEVCGK
ncbi:MAG: GntR family transcriptional regulator [Oscillospiraceae bacterium]|nr:GntR family transcriptional regulator [Oscillospiraceae bacterium]